MSAYKQAPAKKAPAKKAIAKKAPAPKRNSRCGSDGIISQLPKPPKPKGK